MCRPRTLIGVSLVLLIAQSVSCIWYPNNNKREALCSKDECKTRGKLYKNNMDIYTNPCQDFYTFTCGNWQQSHPGPKYYAERSVLDLMITDFAKIIQNMLETYDIATEGQMLYHMAKEVYKFCVKIPEYPKSDGNDIARQVLRVGHLPDTRLWDIHTKYLKVTGESAFFRSTILGEKTEGTPVLIVMEPASAYGSILHEGPWKPEEKKAYTNFLFQIIKGLKLPGTDAAIEDKIEKVFEFRNKLDDIIQQNIERDPEPLHPLTAEELDTWFEDTLGTLTNTQKISWVEVRAALFHKLSAKARRIRNLMAIRQINYFLDLMDLLKNMPEDVIVSHMEIYFIERHLKLNETMNKMLQGTLVEPHNHLRFIREKYFPRWETCIENHNMKEILEDMLYVKWFEPQREQQGMIHQMIVAIKTAISNQMKKSSWVDPSTRVETLMTFHQVQSWVGFPPWVHNAHVVSKSREKREILKPNAELSMEGKWFYIHAPLLISPIFNVKMPAIYNYAGLGTTIGHELYHVIDDCGSYLSGSTNIIWWSDKARKECFKKMEAFIKAYNEITVREFHNHYDELVKVNSSHTVLEDYPDVMGLEAAYIAYKEVASKDKSVCKTLPNFEEFSCDQMFYIAFANTYCGYHNKKSAMQKLGTWDHSIESIRINGAVSQMESFGTAFHCPVGAPMNPEKKVNLWK